MIMTVCGNDKNFDKIALAFKKQQGKIHETESRGRPRHDAAREDRPARPTHFRNFSKRKGWGKSRRFTAFLANADEEEEEDGYEEEDAPQPRVRGGFLMLLYLRWCT